VSGAIVAAALISASVLPTAAIGAAQSPTIEGTWSTETREHDDGRRTVQLTMELDEDTGTWGWSVEASELDGLSFEQLDGNVADARFELVRDAGTVVFQGVIRNGRGIGEFTFTPNAAWQREMTGYGYGDLSERQVFSAAIHDITTAYVGELRQLGYADLPVNDLFSIAIHRVSIAIIRGMNDLGYADIPARKLVSMRIHGVTVEWVRQVRAAMGG
jgi:hypothetical protein